MGHSAVNDLTMHNACALVFTLSLLLIITCILMLTVSRRTKIYAVHYLDDSLVYAVLTVRSEVVSLNAAENPHTCSYSTETILLVCIFIVPS